ncbi:hypothetical protein NCS56_01501500 [Fusarium sp. Ph1]|nr:hypothetical protein NCS56_01501500 [Fusarium sp. Ph1]
MVNPLSSLTAEVAETQLPGYTSLGSSSDDDSHSDDENEEEDDDDAFQNIHPDKARDKEIMMMPSTPPTVNWIALETPPPSAYAGFNNTSVM